MGLASALSTALTGLNASEKTIDVVGNNIANANTVGFKASRLTLSEGIPVRRSLGEGSRLAAIDIGSGVCITGVRPSLASNAEALTLEM